MGTLFSRFRKRSSRESSTVVRRGSSSIIGGQPRSFSSSFSHHPFDGLPERNQNHPFSASTAANNTETKKTTGSAGGMSSSSSGVDKKKKYGYIPDNFTSLDQVLSSYSFTLNYSLFSSFCLRFLLFLSY